MEEVGTLADQFLADLEDDDGDVEEQKEEPENQEKEEEDKEQLPDVKNLLEDAVEENDAPVTVDKLSQLLLSNELKQILQKVEEAKKLQPSKADLQIIFDLTKGTTKIASEITKTFIFIQNIYTKKFPELHTVLLNPLDYVRVVQRIGNADDWSTVSLSDLLPGSTIMVIATMTSLAKLTDEELQQVNKACSIGIQLDDARRTIVGFLDSRVNFVAPNLCKLLGTSTASKMISAVGGLSTLATLPPSNIANVGLNKKSLSGFAYSKPQGYLGESEIVMRTPISMKPKAIQILATKTALAARMDMFSESPTGEKGFALKEEIEDKITKLLSPPPRPPPKPLAAPDDKPKKRRGGKRIRKIKQKYEMTEMRKAFNRVPFGLDGQITIHGVSEKNLGALGLRTGKVRMTAVDKGNIPKAKPGTQTSGLKTSGTSGLATSLAFTPVQGLELSNPAAAQQRVHEANMKYFGQANFKVENKSGNEKAQK